MSAWGAEDMIGNLEEWAADWYVAGPPWQSVDAEAAPWPIGYEEDRTVNVDGRVADWLGWVDGLPAAARRGGMWQNASAAGVFSFSLTDAPSNLSISQGFRCCRRR